MRIVALLALLCSCAEHGSSQPVECDTALCDGNELCRFTSSGIDAGVGNPPSCVAIPHGCSTADCAGNCPSCIDDLCPAPELPNTLSQRVLHCAAQ